MVLISIFIGFLEKAISEIFQLLQGYKNENKFKIMSMLTYVLYFCDIVNISEVIVQRFVITRE